MNLKDVLSEFHGASNEPELQQMFRELAPSLRYGGYKSISEPWSSIFTARRQTGYMTQSFIIAMAGTWIRCRTSRL